MSNYNGRRGPNVSQYLRDLNAINRQETANEEPFNMEEDLALFTNTQFFDFETGQNTDYQAHPVKVDMEVAPSTSPSDGMTPAPSVMGDLSSIDFMQSEFIFQVLSCPLNFCPLDCGIEQNETVRGSTGNQCERKRKVSDIIGINAIIFFSFWKHSSQCFCNSHPLSVSLSRSGL